MAVTPMPSAPASLPPQVQTVPSFRKAAVVGPPAETWAMSVKSERDGGAPVDRGAVAQLAD
ncbi:hypothetical protein Acor_19260 [Acrocarpospora corrugata]|uniref:Uncharacterized protein n=1 Tax=Acrocarpospora corrugata TaxID=35763 RepID=A0A5M3VXS0_9ACTN|nr:hypothetical protein Acor_19260 [Acrocarpospora corrugata]